MLQQALGLEVLLSLAEALLEPVSQGLPLTVLLWHTPPVRLLLALPLVVAPPEAEVLGLFDWLTVPLLLLEPEALTAEVLAAPEGVTVGECRSHTPLNQREAEARAQQLAEQRGVAGAV